MKFIQQNELLKVINGYNNNDKQSSILPNPKFVGEFDTAYKADVEAGTTFTDAVVVNVLDTTDYDVAVVNYDNNTKGAIAVYTKENVLIAVIKQYTQVDTPADLPAFNEVKSNKQDILFGLTTIAGKVNFFILRDVLSFIENPQAVIIQETYFTTLFDIETQIKEDPDSTTNPKEELSVYVGNPKFGTYDKISFNQDFYDANTYAFLLFTESSKEMDVIRFTTGLSQQNSLEADWLINELMSLSQGTTGTGSNFEGLSALAIITGDQSNQKTIGSIMFSNQIDSGVPQTINNKPTIVSSLNPSFDALVAEQYDDRSYGVVQEVLVSDSKLRELLKPIFEIFNNPSNVVNNFSGSFLMKSKYQQKTSGGQLTQQSNINFTLDNAIILKILNSTKTEIKTAFYPPSRGINYIETLIEIDGIAVASVKNSAKTVNGKNVIEHYIYSGYSTGSPYFFERITSSFDFTSTITADYETQQLSVGENTSSQILITNDGTNNVYGIVQSETNSYEGTEPVFISPSKAFIPLKKKDTNQYAIFEFNGQIGGATSTTYWNDSTTKDFTTTEPYKKTLTEPVSITTITLQGGTPLPTTDYSLDTTTGELEIKIPIASGTSIIVEYLTSIGIPKQVHLSTTTSGKDLYIYGIPEQSELPSIGTTIIGAGDDSLDAFGSIISNYDNFVFMIREILKVEDPTYVDGNWFAIPDDKRIYGFKYLLTVATITQVKLEAGKASVKYKGLFGETEAYVLESKPLKIHVGFLEFDLASSSVWKLSASHNIFEPWNIIYLDIPATNFGFNLYRSKPNIDYNEVAEASEPSTTKIKYVRGSRQKDIIFMSAFNDDWSKVVRWLQIYPDSFDPYTYLPYANPDEYFYIDRFNISKDAELKNSRFDNRVEVGGGSGNTMIATSTAETTDLNNQDNNTFSVFGKTNIELFRRTGDAIIKSRTERASLQFTLTTSFIDLLQGKDTENIKQSELLAGLFKDKNNNIHNLIALDKLTILNDDGTKLELNATDYTRMDEDAMILWVELTLQKSDKNPVSATITNKNGDQIISFDIVQCTGNYINISHEIVVSETADGSEFEYFTYGKTPYGKVTYKPNISKGGENV